MNPSDLAKTPNPLAPHYSRFDVANRLLLTGHSHQAWPDAGFEAQAEAWNDAARLVDDKWTRAFETADRVRSGFATLMNDRKGDIALGPSTHDLAVRFLSAAGLRRRPKIVTTSSEFHSLRRQLDRLEEEGIEVLRVPAAPHDTLAERMAELVDERTAVAAVSYVFFDTARIMADPRPLAEACGRWGTHLLVDGYHALNVVPFDLASLGLEDAFVLGGGYKYCQLGEGNCFLRTPPACSLRPVVTGWFAEFDHLDSARRSDEVPYAVGPMRFAGSTYDPASHYRAAAVFDFFADQCLEVPLLREVSQHQIRVLASTFDDLDLPESLITRDRGLSPDEIGGFLVLRSPQAPRLQGALKQVGVLTDSRGESLRFGPAPYLSDDQLLDAMSRLREAVKLIS